MGKEGEKIYPGLDVDAQDNASAQANKDGIGQSASANVGVTEGGKADGVYDKAHEQVGVYEVTKVGAKASFNHGVSVSGGAIAGDGVKAGASGTIGSGKTNVDLSTNVSIGDQIGATGACHATIKGGVLSIGVKGAVAAGLGLKGDVNLNIDTNAVQKDGKSFVHSCNDAWDSTFGKL